MHTHVGPPNKPLEQQETIALDPSGSRAINQPFKVLDIHGRATITIDGKSQLLLKGEKYPAGIIKAGPNYTAIKISYPKEDTTDQSQP